MTYALRTDGDPLRHTATIRQLVHDADSRIPLTNVTTQAAEIDQTINQEIVLARLCTAFAILALVIASVGLYSTMAYGVARRTREIGIRMALGARRAGVIWMVLREVCVLLAVGLSISVPIARGHVAIHCVVALRYEAERSARDRGGSGGASGCGPDRELRARAKGVTHRPDDRPSP